MAANELTAQAQGIDVSAHNGMIGWSSWAKYIEFAEIKATEALSFVDPLFDGNWRITGEMGIHRFAYHYAHPEADPSEQAQFFTNTVRAAGLKKNDQFVLDLENSFGRSPIEVSFWAYVFCNEMNRLNPSHRIIVQTFHDFAQAGYCAKLGPWHLWIMEWQAPKPELPVGPWNSYALWQYATGTVDRDVFNGTAAELDKFCSTVGPQLWYDARESITSYERGNHGTHTSGHPRRERHHPQAA